jgi:hypothetical protein
MELELSDEQVAELSDLLASAVGDLHSEIAGTDNAGYRRTLQRRLETLDEVRKALGGTTAR